MYKEKLFNRDFTLLALGQAFSLVGNYALKIALSMYVLELTGSAAVFAGMLALAIEQKKLAPGQPIIEAVSGPFATALTLATLISGS